jgi:PAS domain S-box-containing protein
MKSDIILAVDDHEGVLEVYRRIFAAKEAKEFDVLGWVEDAGSLPPLECRTYNSPKKLIEDVRHDALRGVHYPLCIVDVLMPEQNGVATVRQLREIDPEIEIIICTADPGTVPLGVQGELGERIFFVRKPPVTDEFVLMVHTLVGYWRDRQELRRKTAFLTRLLESVSDLIFMKDPQGIYRTCNQKFATFAGREPAEIIGHSDSAFIPPERCVAYRKQDLEVVEQGRPVTYREEVVHPDGTRRLLETVKSPVFSENGECVGLIGIGRDITEREGAG